MQLSELLKPAAVKTIASATSKKRLFHDIAEMAHVNYGFNAHDVVDALLERENLGPTGVGQGIALPHARLQEAENICGIFIRLEKPLDFDSVDRQPVDLVFTLLAPDAAGVEHLKALALVSRTMRNPSICAKLRANSDPATIHAILTEAQATQAA